MCATFVARLCRDRGCARLLWRTGHTHIQSSLTSSASRPLLDRRIRLHHGTGTSFTPNQPLRDTSSKGNARRLQLLIPSSRKPPKPSPPPTPSALTRPSTSPWSSMASGGFSEPSSSALLYPASRCFSTSSSRPRSFSSSFTLSACPAPPSLLMAP